MYKKILFFLMIMVVSCSVLAQDQGQSLWFDDFESYMPDNGIWTDEEGVPWIQVVDDLGLLGPTHVEYAGQWPSGNGTKMLMGRTSVSTRAWTRRPFGEAIDPTEDVQVTARVCANTDGRDTAQVGWPVSNHIFLAGVGIGIHRGYLSWGPLEYGVATPTNTYPPSYSQILVRPRSATGADPWYDVKIIVHQIAGSDNDTADIYYKVVGDSDWIEVTTGYDTGKDLDDSVWVYQYNSGASSARYYPGWIDHVRLSSPPVGEMCEDLLEHMTADINKDCSIDLVDFALFSEKWLDCTDPEIINCVH